MPNIEEDRLQNQGNGPIPEWQKWGPYVSERSWGTVREDYSSSGDAWNYFPFERAHSKAYRWGEDGIAGWCDRYQSVVFSPAFWNGKDPILKERLFGLSSPEGNHGEDVKEYYYYLDGVPSHAYMKYLYKYPHEQFPYQKLREENKKRTTADPEYELIDTGVLEKNRYFDIFIEYIKNSPDDFSIKIEAFNRGDVEHDLHIIPQLWFRNQWSWTEERKKEPQIYFSEETTNHLCLISDDTAVDAPQNLGFEYKLGKRYLYGPKGAECLLTNNETHVEGAEKPGEFYKDAFHEKIVQGKLNAVSAQKGTKGCLHYYFPKIESGKSVCIYLRSSANALNNPLEELESLFIVRKQEADEFYKSIHPVKASEEEKMIQRQALAGMIWSKQIYLYDASLWLNGDNAKFPTLQSHRHIRNMHWGHLNSMRIFSMPDKWEYPWFAAWDQSFHSVTWSLIDLNFAKEQVWLLLFDQFQHPNGQIPAYEWEFSDLNPPVQAWAALQLFEKEKEKTGKGDRAFLEKCFHKLLMNFSWWVNKVDNSGNNVFEGGFLGLDNITVLDRSEKRNQDSTLQQSDGTGWMAFFCLNLMKIALELSEENNVYESLATKFFEHYVYIAQAMTKKGRGSIELWDEKDGFFYDVLRHKDGTFSSFPIRSLVGIIPVFAVEYFSEEYLKRFPSLYRDLTWFLKNRKDLVSQCVIQTELSSKPYYVLTPISKDRLESILGYAWNPNEFRSEYGLRSLSKYHEKNPFEFQGNKVSYESAESLQRIKGGNSNWRGPVWMPLNFLLIQSLRKLSFVFEEQIQIKAPGEGPVSLGVMADSFSKRLINIFTLDAKGFRPFLGQEFLKQKDPNWSDYCLFYEHFNPETGKGVGASHQSGWTSLIANVIDSLEKKQI